MATQVLGEARTPSATSPVRPGAGSGAEPVSGPRSPEWPLVVLFAGFPLWWLLGVGEFSCLLFAVPMAVYLARQRRIEVPRGFGVWLLFVAWVVGGVFVLQVHAPGTIEQDSLTRYFTFGYRLLWYLAATVVLLYVGNLRRQVSDRRIALALSTMFVIVTCGGVLGMLAPHLQFRSPLEIALPHGLSSNGFVHGLIHPVTAQVQDFLGYAEARPSAPFPYTNEWGLAMACFLPFFLITWCRRDAGWRRYVAPLVLLVAIVTVVYSLNRGLWLALATAAVFVAVRAAALGKAKVLAILVGGTSAIAAIIAVSPLGGLVLDRLAHPHSNQGRTNLGSLTVSSVLQGSPLLGFGGTRNVQGNFSSIAQGATALCPGCSPPPLGTQGHLWLVLFSQGFVGLALYLAFFVSQLVRHLRLSSPYVTAALSVLVVHLVTMPVYDSIGPSFFAIMIAVGLLWRARIQEQEAGVSRSPRRRQVAGESLAAYAAVVRRHAIGLLALALVGGVAGAAYEVGRGIPATGSQSVLLPLSPAALVHNNGTTLDTDARLVTADPVLTAVVKATHYQLSRSEVEQRLSVTVSPNTRIVHIFFRGSSPSQARAGIHAATAAYLRMWNGLQHVSTGGAEAGQIVQEVEVSRSSDGLVVGTATGGMVALILGLVGWRRRGDRRARLRQANRVRGLTGLPVYALPAATAPGASHDGQVGFLVEAFARQPAANFLATDGSTSARRVASALDAAGARLAGFSVTTDSVIVTSTKTRLGEFRRLRAALTSTGQHVRAVVLVEDK